MHKIHKNINNFYRKFWDFQEWCILILTSQGRHNERLVGGLYTVAVIVLYMYIVPRC